MARDVAPQALRCAAGAFQIIGRAGVLERGVHGNSGKRGKRRLPSAFPRSSVRSVIQILAHLEFAKILKCTLAPPRI
jgi:hypothetical protein